MAPSSAQPIPDAPRAAATASGDERRRALILAAYQLIAGRGFEGFRVRDVSAQVGITNATLHYYFPTKEALIQAVVDYIIEYLISTYDPNRETVPSNPLEALQAHFTDLLYQLRVTPERFIVLSELLLRSRRDTTIAAMLRVTEENWYHYLRTLLDEALQQGLIRSDLNVHAAVLLIMTTFKGTILQLTMEEEDRQQTVTQLTRWITG